MSDKISKTVTNQTVGYTFRVIVERETRKVTEAKYPDKTVVTLSLGGNETTFEKAVGATVVAQQTIKQMLDDGGDKNES